MKTRGVAIALLAGAVACQPDAPAPSGPRVERPSFSGTSAYAHVETQVAFGPRIPGSDGHAAQLAWMLAWLTERADTVVADAFDHVTSGGDTLALVNVLARFNPGADGRVLLLTHWDTRPRADQSPDPEDQAKPVPGANDGASGTAVLMELADMLSRQAPTVGIDGSQARLYTPGGF